jgi:hypothetical protein
LRAEDESSLVEARKVLIEIWSEERRLLVLRDALIRAPVDVRSGSDGSARATGKFQTVRKETLTESKSAGVRGG